MAECARPALDRMHRAENAGDHLFRDVASSHRRQTLFGDRQAFGALFEEDSLDIVEFVAHGTNAADGRSQLVGIERLGDPTRRAGLTGTAFLVVGELGGEHQDRRAAKLRDRAYRFDQFEAVHLGHVDIGDQQVGNDFVHAFEAVDAVVRALDLKALRGQRGLQQHAHAGRVIDGEDELAHWDTSFSVSSPMASASLQSCTLSENAWLAPLYWMP